MMIFVVGPSGGGKTRLIAEARKQRPELDTLDLDAEEVASGRQEWMEGWASRRWPRDQTRLNEAEGRAGDGLILVDVGAGSLQTPAAVDYFVAQSHRLLTVMAPLEVVKARKHPNRDEANLRDTEYSDARMKVYRAATFTITNTGAADEGTREFLRALDVLSGRRAEGGAGVPQFRLVKDRDEGTTTPYIARFWSGLHDLRNNCLGSREIDTEKACRLFDETFAPVLTALDAVRDADKTIKKVVSDHRAGIENGELVSFQRNAVNIHASINRQLRDTFERFLNSGVRATKSMQGVAEPFALKIGFLFQKQGAFDKGAAELEASGHGFLAAYLKSTRFAWSEEFLERRNQMEHFGWQLPDVMYPEVGGRVAMTEPTVDRVAVSQYTDHMTRRILAFVEEITAYCFAQCLPKPIVILAEVPPEQRNPINAHRFVLSPPGQLPAWEITYNDEGFR